MTGGMTCVAGIDLSSKAMVRPLQVGGQNWERAEWVASGYMRVGNILALTPAASADSAYPHATEDFRVAKVGVTGSITPAELYEICRETADPDLETIFDEQIKWGKYVIEQTNCRSLGCVMIEQSSLSFTDDGGDLRAVFTGRAGDEYNLKVTELALREKAATAARAMLESAIGASDQPVALRIGLARAWDGGEYGWNPKRCYLQLNGIVLPA